MVEFLPVIVDGVFVVVPIFGETLGRAGGPVSLLRLGFVNRLLCPLPTQNLNERSDELSYIRKDLRRIALLAASITVVLIALSFMI